MPDTQEATTEVERAVAGLRELADFIEEHPQFIGALHDSRFLMYVIDPDEFPGLVRELGGQREKSTNDAFFAVSRFFDRIELYVYTDREQVCEARVVGTEKVLIADPAAPKIEVEREIVEWDCKPIIAKAVA